LVKAKISYKPLVIAIKIAKDYVIKIDVADPLNIKVKYQATEYIVHPCWFGEFINSDQFKPKDHELYHLLLSSFERQ
jgi:hypothetical protein